MNRLPDMILIDFFDWLSQSDCLQLEEVDVYNLILDAENNDQLIDLAQRYLDSQRNIENVRRNVRRILRRFLDSEEFAQCVNERYPRSSQEYLEFVHLSRDLAPAFSRFRRDDKRKHPADYFEITEYRLVSSLREMFSHPKGEKAFENPRLISCMNRLNMHASIEVDFFEWICRNFKEPLNLERMPIRTFTALAEKFKKECKKSDSEIKKLVNSFKNKSIQSLINKLFICVSPNNARIGKDLNNLYKRYQDKNIRFKCMIIPLSADSDEYIELIEKRWFDLHYLSGDLLDIYYSKTDYGKSGYQITQKLDNLPSNLKHKAPIIVLWENKLKDAKSIDISRLDNEQIFEVISCVVNAIEAEKTFEEIVEEANKMSQNLRDEQRPIYNNTVNIGDNAEINGIVGAVVKNNKLTTTIYKTSKESAGVLEELDKAKEIIRNFSEINDKQKERLSQIIDEAQRAVKDDSEPQKESVKKRFAEAIDLIGVGTKLISAFSSLTNVLEFFGITPG